MGKKHETKRYNRMYNRKLAAPELPKHIKDIIKNEGIELPKAKTAKEFYAQLGLSADPNDTAPVGYSDKLGEIIKNSKNTEKKTNSIINLEDFANKLPHGDGYKKHLTEYELKCIAQLKLRYGDDLEMMARDHRHNPMQWTIKQLQSKMKIYDYESQIFQNSNIE